MAALTILHGPDKGRVYRTRGDLVLLGRSSDQLPLGDQTTSRRHAELEREGDDWRLRDLNSANGTYVNSKRVEQAVTLKHGDRIKIGRTELMFTDEDAVQRLNRESIPADMVRLDTSGEEELRADSIVSIESADDSIVMAAPETTFAVKSWKAIRDLTDAIGSLVTPDALLHRVLDILFEEIPADRGVIFLRDEETRELLPEVVRFRNRKARADATRNAISSPRAILQHVMEQGKAVLCANVKDDERFAGGSLAGFEARSLIAAPVLAKDQVLGVIHLDTPTREHVYNEQELRLVTAIGYQTGLAIEHARLLQAQLQRERLAATGETVAYLSHAIKNILQGMRAGADVVERGLDARNFDTTQQGWGILDRNLEKCYALMLNMLAFSKQREPNLEMRQVNDIIRDVIGLVKRQADEVGITIETNFEAELPEIPLDFDGVHQALLNLVANAIDVVAHDTGRITLTTSLDPVERRVHIRVRDNGPGVPAEQHERIFDPFFSTKGQRGTGLGLAVTRKIIRELDGTIALESPAEGGAEFHVVLPTAEARQASPSDTQRPS